MASTPTAFAPTKPLEDPLAHLPCSSIVEYRKGQIRDMLAYHDIWKQHAILYGGLVELVVNAMSDVPPGFIEWEWR